MSQTSESSSARPAEDMHDTGTTDQARVKWTLVGPGLVAAATGVGAADLVATMIAGQRYGYALLWAVIIGTIMKIVLVEGVGRYSLATGNTMFHGWRELGRWTSWYFAPLYRYLGTCLWRCIDIRSWSRPQRPFPRNQPRDVGNYFRNSLFCSDLAWPVSTL